MFNKFTKLFKKKGKYTVDTTNQQQIRKEIDSLFQDNSDEVTAVMIKCYENNKLPPKVTPPRFSWMPPPSSSSLQRMMEAAEKEQKKLEIKESEIKKRTAETDLKNGVFGSCLPQKSTLYLFTKIFLRLCQNLLIMLDFLRNLALKA